MFAASPIMSSVSAGTITAPTFISENETVWNTTATPKTTGSIAVNIGDILLAYSVIENDDGSDSITVAGGGLTWNPVQTVHVTSFCNITVVAAVATSTTSFAVTFTHNLGNAAYWFGGNVLVFRGSAGIGASQKNNTTGLPTLSLTTTVNNSAILNVIGDFAAVDGTVRTWNTINGITPTSGNGLETSYSQDPVHYALYAAYYTSAGNAGAKSTGLQTPGGQTYSIVSVEIKGQ